MKVEKIYMISGRQFKAKISEAKRMYGLSKSYYSGFDGDRIWAALAIMATNMRNSSGIWIRIQSLCLSLAHKFKGKERYVPSLIKGMSIMKQNVKMSEQFIKSFLKDGFLDRKTIVFAKKPNYSPETND